MELWVLQGSLSRYVNCDMALISFLLYQSYCLYLVVRGCYIIDLFYYLNFFWISFVLIQTTMKIPLK